jgi:hypothetical protein
MVKWSDWWHAKLIFAASAASLFSSGAMKGERVLKVAAMVRASSAT